MYFSKDTDSVPPPSNHPGSTGAGPRHIASMYNLDFCTVGTIFFEKFNNFCNPVICILFCLCLIFFMHDNGKEDENEL